MRRLFYRILVALLAILLLSYLKYKVHLFYWGSWIFYAISILSIIVIAIFLFRKKGLVFSLTPDNEQMFKSLLEAAPDAIIIINEEGNIVFVNQQTERLFEYNRNELINKAVATLIPESYKDLQLNNLVVSAKQPKLRLAGTSLELEAVRKNGQAFPAEISLSPLYTHNGILISADVRDVTERKKAQLELLKLNEELEKRVEERTQAMLRSELKFKALVENNGSIIALFDKELNITYCSPSCEHILGWKLVGGEKTFLLNLLHPDDVKKVNNVFEQVMNNPDELYKLSFRATDKNGDYIWLEGVVKNLFHDESVGAIITNLQDVTEQKEAEAKIIETQIMLRSSIESSQNMSVSFVDKEYRYRFFNNAHKISMYHIYDKKIQAGDSMLDSITLEKDKVIAAANLDRAFNGESHIEIQQYGETDRGYYEIRFNPVYNECNEIIGATVFSFNITDRILSEQALKRNEVELEKKVQERTEQLEASYREMEAFTYSVSHDLRAPLRGIAGFTSILQREYAEHLDAEGQRIANVIKNNTLKMGTLIDELLNFSRVSKQQIVKEKTNMGQLVTETIESTEIKNPNTKFEIDKLPSVPADVNTLRQVWVNLISNALKYSAKKETPEIKISSIENNDEYIFSVSDNGVGFDETYANKLFKVFQRLHGPKEFEGTGVGLAIVEKIISKHGGRVWASGAVNNGATFYFSLPKR